MADRPKRQQHRKERPGKPDAAPDDATLFREVMRDVKPLARRTPKPTVADTVLAASPKAPAGSAPRQRTARSAAPTPAAASPPRPADLAHGDVAGLDRRTALRFRRGQLAVEARLDLHGMTQAEAHRALDAFLAGQQAAGRRCVIVVTGKGVAREGGGVLRAAVPRWLNEAPNRDRVLAFAYARQKDGGAGALYVLLKRRRG